MLDKENVEEGGLLLHLSKFPKTWWERGEGNFDNYSTPEVKKWLEEHEKLFKEVVSQIQDTCRQEAESYRKMTDGEPEDDYLYGEDDRGDILRAGKMKGRVQAYRNVLALLEDSKECKG